MAVNLGRLVLGTKRREGEIGPVGKYITSHDLVNYTLLANILHPMIRSTILSFNLHIYFKDFYQL